MKILGNKEYLYDCSYRAEAIFDPFVPDSHIWVVVPTYEYNAFANQYIEVIKVLSSPKNFEVTKDLVDRHNTIWDSPLMKALREEN